MNLRDAMNLVKNYVIFGDPWGDMGSFEPIKGVYNNENETWEITCKFTKKRVNKKAIVTIDNRTSIVKEYMLLEG